MLFDTHAHYDDEAFDPDRELLLESLPQRGVALVLNPGCDLDSSRKAVSYAAAYPHVYAAVGIHPENCAGFVPADIDVLRELARQPKVAAIGEIGLDYYWAENPPRKLQQQVLRAQLALARALRLPVIFHDREAHGDSLAIVREFPDVTGVFHCFSGSPEMARELLDLGWYLGFDGPVTYKNARRAPEVAAVTPLDRMLIETDSPYMTPVPHRGERNDSAYVRLVAEKLAVVRERAAARGRTLQYGIRLHVIVRETEEEAWAAADRLIAHLDDDTIAQAQKIFARMDSAGQARMSALHHGSRDNLRIAPNLWAGVGLVRGGAGTALVGNPQQVAERIREYQALGISNFIFSGYPHLEEAHRFAELVMPLLPLENGASSKARSVNTGPFGETIGGDKRPVRQVSAS